MKGWHIGVAALVLGLGAAGWASTAAAKPAEASELEVAPDCSTIVVKDKARIVARVGAIVVKALPSDDTPLLDLVVQVLNTLVPQCTWPPPEGLDPEFSSPDGSAKWSTVLPLISSMTWGEARAKLGSLDMATPSGASPVEIAAGLTVVAALSGRKGYG